MKLKLKINHSSPLFWHYVASMMALLMVATPFAIYNQLVDKGPSWLGLDVSWKMTLNYALNNRWQWGKDIVYTYGPLAFLSTRTGWGIPVWAFLVFDIFLLVNFYFVFAGYLTKSKNKLLAIAVLICMMLVVNQTFGADLSWVMLFLIIWWMLKTLPNPKPGALVMLILLTTLAFYIKMNTGLIAIILVTGHLLNLFICKKISLLKMLYYAVLLFIMIWFTAILFNVSIFSYITGSLNIIKGYNDIMYLDENHSSIQFCLYVLFTAILTWLLFKLWRQFVNKRYYLIPYIVTGIIYIFLLQKQSVLRNDLNHLYEFFAFAPLILLCDFCDEKIIPVKSQYYSAAILFMALCFISTVRTPWFTAGRRIAGPVNYLKQTTSFDNNAYANQPGKRYIPKRVLDIIGNKTVDIFPWDSEYAFENKLNYKPRPVFQSFSAYTSRLEAINYNYYVQHPPDFIIYNYDAIDGRYAFNDEPLVNMFILVNYMPVDTFQSNERLRVVLQRKNTVKPLAVIRHVNSNVPLTDTTSTDDNNFIRLNIAYNLLGRIRSFFYKPPQVQVSYMRKDGKWFTYKTSVELLKSGMFTGALISNDDEYLAVFKGQTPGAITKIKIDVNSRYFNSKADLETYRMDAFAGVGQLKTTAEGLLSK